MRPARAIVDGNEAAASVAYRTSEVISIYPITPSSPMGELADSWANRGLRNVWGGLPVVVEMQSEGGAAGTVHGALQAGALTTTFTASQGLLLMIPNMFKIAGELTPAVFHVASRSVATHALSIFGDHSDVMAVRSTGWAMMSSSSVQEAQDFALISLMATLETRVPFLHFFDGFRTSHELKTIELLGDDDIRALIDPEPIRAHRRRRLDPDAPVLRGSAQNPDVFFQAREAANPYYAGVPAAVESAMERFHRRTGRRYRLCDYVGAPDAERLLVLMGSGAGAAEEAVRALTASGEKVGLLKMRLFRPFPAEAMVAALPPTTRALAVLDRTKEPGALGEPLYQDVLTALAEQDAHAIRVIGGRYGLSSKEFTPAMAAGVLAELALSQPKRHFTVGINDDVSSTSLDYDPSFTTEGDDVVRAVFFGLGADGTVGANRSSTKIIGDHTGLHAQGYFVYDSKKAGARTVSHLRFSPHPIESTYLIGSASFVACHQFHFLETIDVLDVAAPGATFLLNSPFPPDTVWDRLPREVQEQIIAKDLDLYVVDAQRIADGAGLGTRINTVMQACFFALTDLMPTEDAMGAIESSIEDNYRKYGHSVVQRNLAAVGAAVSALHKVAVPVEATATAGRPPLVPDHSPDFVQRVTRLMLEGKGDLLPVSAMPVDGTFPTATSRWEKRSIAHEIPVWDPEICIDCGKCAIVCPHAAIRMKVYDPADLAGAPEGFKSKEYKSHREFVGYSLTVQVAPDDCTGCGVCVDMCPAVSKEEAKHKSIDMEPKAAHLGDERRWYEYFLQLPEADRTEVRTASVKGSQMLQPLFEYSGACAGCGETPYLKLLSQLFGDRTMVANATGCSSIYGGNLPTTPWAVDGSGRGPAWSNSLFEDNAEFGLGMRLAIDRQADYASALLEQLRLHLGDELVDDVVTGDASGEEELARLREGVGELTRRVQAIDDDAAREFAEVVGLLVPRSIWIVGGDGWAYDIGFGGLDHVLASGRNVNVLVLDTEVYSNTGGQASKATPRAAVAKFAAGGKRVGKKDLGMIAAAYGNVYVAQVAMGANQTQTVKAFIEAESWPGPSLIIAYSPCIAHGIDMATSMSHSKEAVDCGYWPLYRYDPRNATEGNHPFHLDSRKPSIPFVDFAMKEARYAMLERANPAEAERLLQLAQEDIDERWRYYEQITDIERSIPGELEEAEA